MVGPGRQKMKKSATNTGIRKLRVKKRKYEDEMFQQALDMIERGNMSVREAAKTYGVPRSTLQDKINNTHPRKDGGPTVLSEDEEQHIVEMLLLMSEWGFPWTSQDLRYFVKSYLDKKGKVTRFVDNLPTHRFVKRFLGRHSQLSVRTANPIKRSRAAVSREEVQAFLERWEKTIDGVPPENIFNWDETNFTDDPGTRKCLVKRGMKYVERVQNTSKQSVSVMFCGSAAGQLMPLHINYKAKYLWTSWTERGPPGTVYSATLSGWFDMATCEKFFFDVALPVLRKLSGRKVKLGIKNH